MSACRSCGAPIRWVRVLEGGARMPLDPLPRPDGNVVVHREEADEPTAEIPDARELAELRESGAETFVTHFATCPNADRHRRRR